MRTLSESLTALIATAEDMMRRPAHTIPPALPEALIELAAAIRHADALPCDGVRATRAGIVMVTAIEAFFAEATGDHHWQMLIGAILPVLRREAWRARRNERDATEQGR